MGIRMKTKEQSIIQLDFSEEMRNSYRDYAMSVIASRALQDGASRLVIGRPVTKAENPQRAVSLILKEIRGE